MNKTLAVLGLLCAVAPLARADDLGVVTRFEGPNVTCKVGLNQLRVGERVKLTVMPERRNGYGYAIVSDLDVNTHEAALRLLPVGGSDTGGARNAPTGTFHGNTRLFLDDTVRLTSLHTFTDSVPDFRLDHPADWPAPYSRDIELPAGMPMVRLHSGVAGGGSSAPAAPSGAAGSRMPDVDALLRSLGGGTAAGESVLPERTSPDSLDVSPSRGDAHPADGLFKVARADFHKSAR